MSARFDWVLDTSFEFDAERSERDQDPHAPADLSVYCDERDDQEVGE
jgi:hypothetical protein